MNNLFTHFQFTLVRLPLFHPTSESSETPIPPTWLLLLENSFWGIVANAKIFSFSSVFWKNQNRKREYHKLNFSFCPTYLFIHIHIHSTMLYDISFSFFSFSSPISDLSTVFPIRFFRTTTILSEVMRLDYIEYGMKSFSFLNDGLLLVHFHLLWLRSDAKPNQTLSVQ